MTADTTIVEALTVQQAEGLLTGVVERNSAVLVEWPNGGEWLRGKSRFLGRADGRPTLLWLERPDGPQPNQRVRLEVGCKLLVHFTWDQRRYRFATAVAQIGRLRLTGGAGVEGVLVTYPAAIQRLQRRANYRCLIPATQRVNVALWEGGQAARDMAQAGGEPMFRGQLVNLSVGGLCVHVYGRFDPRLAEDSLVGVEFALGPPPPLLLDAVVRRSTVPANGGVDLGVKFVGLQQTPRGRAIQELLSTRLADVQRQSLQRSRGK